MHTAPWFRATNIPNVSAKNLVQIGIGGQQSPRLGVKFGHERHTTIMTVTDCVEMGMGMTPNVRSKSFGMASTRSG
jgi:agmatinase